MYFIYVVLKLVVLAAEALVELLCLPIALLVHFGSVVVGDLFNPFIDELNRTYEKLAAAAEKEMLITLHGPPQDDEVPSSYQQQEAEREERSAAIFKRQNEMAQHIER